MCEPRRLRVDQLVDVTIFFVVPFGPFVAVKDFKPACVAVIGFDFVPELEQIVIGES